MTLRKSGYLNRLIDPKVAEMLQAVVASAIPRPVDSLVVLRGATLPRHPARAKRSRGSDPNTLPMRR